MSSTAQHIGVVREWQSRCTHVSAQMYLLKCRLQRHSHQVSHLYCQAQPQTDYTDCTSLYSALSAHHFSFARLTEQSSNTLCTLHKPNVQCSVCIHNLHHIGCEMWQILFLMFVMLSPQPVGDLSGNPRIINRALWGI